VNNAVPKIIDVEVMEGEGGVRVDRFLSSKIDDISRSSIARLIKESAVLLDDKKIIRSHATKVGERYSIRIDPPKPTKAEAEEMELNIVYEDGDIIIVNKSAGIVVHPAKGNHTGTLVNGLLFHCKDLSGIGGEERPGIVHRLDKDTSGLIAVAKNDKAHNSLSKQLASREMGREYLAIVRGVIKGEKGRIDKPIGRHPEHRKKISVNTNRPKDAITDYEVLERYKDSTYLKVSLRTGRTHQIRVHLSSINHPILGDLLYGKKKTNLISRPALHATKMRLIHPSTGKEILFEAKPPDDFNAVLKHLRSGFTL